VIAIARTAAASVSATLLAAAVTSTVSTSTTGRTFLELRVGLFDRVEKGDAHLLCALNLEGIRATRKCQSDVSQDRYTSPRNVRNVEIHLLITLHLSIMFLESTAPTLDLDSATRLLLDVLDIRSTSSNDLGAQVETGNGLEIDRDTLLRPLATAQMIALDLGLFLSRATEATLVDQIRKFLLHHLFDFLDSCLQTFLRDACDVEVKRRVLEEMSASPLILKVSSTHRSSRHALVRVVISSGSNILKSVSSFGPK
jgi:hypothetical protein